MAAIPSPAESAAVKAGKTKAKQRYLKRKKERKKHRKVAAPAKHAAPASIAPTGNIEEERESDDDEGEHRDEDTTVLAEGESEIEVNGEEASRKEKKRERKERKAKKGSLDESKEPAPPSRKRRKVDDEPTDVVASASPAPAAPRTPTPPPGPLPSFPLPVQPDAPSKLDLALQGLDQALVEAEIVDPSSVQRLATDGADDDGTGLSDRTRKRLGELGITELFAVQTALLPFLLPKDPARRALYLPYDPPRDACVSAPTGSGKTLAYVLPIIEVLSKRIVTRLRALIVLPTRDLVAQVRETFEAVGKGHGLKIGTATGQHSFAHEQGQLVADRTTKLQGGSSKVDILICTPGRLIDHLNATPNFSLQHLRFLVIDEADRLLAQSFQDWLARVLASTCPPSTTEPLVPSSPASPLPTTQAPSTNVAEAPTELAALPYPDAVAPAFAPVYPWTELDERRAPSCQKLLFSATLTRDPGKLRALALNDPCYFVVQAPRAIPSADAGEADAERVGDVLEGMAMERFSMPATLREHMLVCEGARKPLMLFHLVRSRGVTNALVFTKSADAATRLVKLFDFFAAAGPDAGADADAAPMVARAYSSDLPASERRALLEKFKAQEIDILVCSDLVARGIDIAHVAHVVSYDAPVDMRKYVHRVGRTARAGRAGDAWTLVEEQEARYFKAMLKEAEHFEKVKRVRVAEKDVAPLLPAYELALKQLKETYARS